MADIIQATEPEERKKPEKTHYASMPTQVAPAMKATSSEPFFLPCRRRDRHFKRFPFRPPLALTLRLQGPASQERFPFLPII